MYIEFSHKKIVIFHSYVSLPKGYSYNGNFSSENDGDLSIHRWRLNNN